jgi:hypothetical protein
MNNIEKYLNQDINNPEFLFHGSPLKLDNIKPRLSHDSLNQQNNIAEAIFLFPSFLKSIPYSFKDKIKENNDTYSFNIPNGNTMPIMTISETEHIDENITGYIYVFKKDKAMIKDEGESLQYKCYKELKPIDIIEVKLKDYLKYINIKQRISTSNFIFDEFDFDNLKHLKLEKKLIESDSTELILKDINNFIKRNIELRKNDYITNTYVISYEEKPIGLAFVNYHPKIEKNDLIYEEKIKIGLGLLPCYRDKLLGSKVEKELSDKLLELYPNFIVTRMENQNLRSIKAALNAEFEHINK